MEKVRDTSSGQSANVAVSSADSYLESLMTFKFLVSAVTCICQHVLQYTKPLTVALQGTNYDLYKAHGMAQRLNKTLELDRSAENFQSLWVGATKISSDLSIKLHKRRTVSMQRLSQPPCRRHRESLQGRILLLRLPRSYCGTPLN